MMTQAIWPGCCAKASATESMLLYWKRSVSAVVLGGIPAGRGAVQSCQPLYPPFEDLGAACGYPCEPHGCTRRVRSRPHQVRLLGSGEEVDQSFGQVHLPGTPQGRDAHRLRLLCLHRSGDFRSAVTEDDRAVSQHEVDVPLSVHVPQVGAVGPDDVPGYAALDASFSRMASRVEAHASLARARCTHRSPVRPPTP